MAAEHFVNALVSRGIVGGVKLRAGGNQRLDDGNVVRPGLMDGGPHRRAQNRATVHVLYFERRFSPDEQLDRIQLSTICRPVKAVQSGVGPCGRIHTLDQEKVGDTGSTKKTRTGE